MPAKINLLNQQFGKLIVVKETSERRNKSVVWECKCECGNIVKYTTKELRSDGIIQCPQCGHNRKPQTNLLENLIGKKFNHLTVLGKTNQLSGGKIVYKCECDCGSGKYVYTTRTDLNSNHTTSCGCSSLKYQLGDIINNKIIIGLYPEEQQHSKHHHYYRVKCLLCNREYDALSQSLEKTIGCGCQHSKGEFYIRQILNENNIKYKAKYVFSDLPSKRFDFVLLDENNNIIRIIEFDGEQHYEKNIKNTGWNTQEHYEKAKQSDEIKNNYCKNNQIELIRIPYWERDNLSIEMLLGDQYLI